MTHPLGPRDPGIQAHLRMVSWNLNSLRLGGDQVHPNDPLTYGEPGSLGRDICGPFLTV